MNTIGSLLMNYTLFHVRLVAVEPMSRCRGIVTRFERLFVISSSLVHRIHRTKP